MTALNSVWVRQNATVTGDVVVVDAAPGPVLADSAEVVVGLSALVTGAVTAHRVRLKDNGHVTGDVLTNELTGGGSFGGALVSPLALPVAETVPAVPELELDAGAADVTLLQKEDRSLAPGDYGDVKLKAGTQADPTVLTLEGGTYELRSLDLGDRSRVECAAPCAL